MEHEQQGVEGNKPKETNENSDNGVQPQTGSIVEQANQAAERIKAENDRAEKLLRERQEMEAKKVLSGQSEGPAQQEKQEDSEKDYAEGLLSGKFNEKSSETPE